jgi:thiol-disulfide isomerase/thioredoxin
VFYASWCPHCKELLPKLNELKKNQFKKNLELVAVSLDSKKEDWVNFAGDNCSNLINVSDLKGWDGKVACDFYIYATPTMFIVDKEKKIISKPTAINEIVF